ncbi:MauE/DoxX family redox-associated membrane protein [Mucilaginibacter ginsenosidivorax]|uniref:Methylamine utilisation protein MauE domain-containing protein n=1 Tax=Mucilaginibacter ginsenosidivorax TaxID=862126 RepID=A0A5B8W7E7_9SPHI|nr:MauE/DoxX family redox-associated membrane protein [Mucilaginibacter ginsenosidivorax]QEC78856.1 hypothetical protein FSB76_23970 [Mucilaginibacter ginsenosidivorax]
MKKQAIQDSLSALLVLLFVYASFSKYADFKYFQQSMHRQPFPNWLVTSIIWMLPPLEIAIAGLLAFSRTRLLGLYAFIIIMSLFTFYIVAILLNLFPIVPCSCGGLIQSLGWLPHLFLNLFFILIAGLVLRMEFLNIKKERKNSTKNQR